MQANSNLPAGNRSMASRIARSDRPMISSDSASISASSNSSSSCLSRLAPIWPAEIWA
jgi:hypothetical protein